MRVLLALGQDTHPGPRHQTPAVPNTVCLMLPFSAWGCSGAWPEVFGRGAWLAPSLTAVPQTGNKSLRKCRIVEDGTKSRDNLLAVLPTPPPDSRRIPLFMLNRGRMRNRNANLREDGCLQTTLDKARRGAPGDQAAVHQVRSHVWKSFQGTIGGSRGGTFCLSAFWLEFIWRGLIGGSAFVNLDTSNAGESSARRYSARCVRDSIQAFTSRRGAFLIYRVNTPR